MAFYLVAIARNTSSQGDACLSVDSLPSHPFHTTSCVGRADLLTQGRFIEANCCSIQPAVVYAIPTVKLHPIIH